MPALPVGTVTFLFTDVEGFTRHCEENEVAALASLRYHDGVIYERVEAYGGTVFKTGGDAFFVAFPLLERAVCAAIEIQRQFSSTRWKEIGAELRVRMALHVGTAELRDGDYFGLAVNRTDRILKLGHGGQILLSSGMAEVLRESPLPDISLRSLDGWHLKGMSRPEIVYQLVASGLPESFPALRAVSDVGSNLPVMLSSFVGRTVLRRYLLPLVERYPLVTLRGAGGCGKTRLAVELARQVLPDFEGGVWFVRLDALEDANLIPSEVARVMRLFVSPGESVIEILAERLRHRPALLVLDNCEHMLLGCAQLANDLLANCPPLRILATSREALSVPGEQVREVGPLVLPKGGKVPTLAAMRASEAVQLFLTRANASAELVLSRQNLSAVAEICRALDGIPLALELAAKWVGTLPVDQIAQELRTLINDPIDEGESLVPLRQQTMRAAVDWTYRRLSPAEQKLFRYLSPFVGGFTLDAARAVAERVIEIDAGSPTGTLRLLRGLVERSLVCFDKGAKPDPRYRLLEPIREVALGMLEGTSEEIDARTCHREWVCAYARKASEEMIGPNQAEWLDRLEADNDNCRAALRWGKDPQATLALAVAMHRFWQIRDYLQEGIGWLQRCLVSVTESTLRIDGLNAAGILCYVNNQDVEAGTYFREALGLYREQEIVPGIAKSLNNIALVEARMGNLAEAEKHFEECLHLYRRLEDSGRVATVLSNLSLLAYQQADYERACALCEESILLHQATNNLSDLAIALHNLAIFHYDQGDYRRALREHRASLEVRIGLKHERGEMASVFRIALTLAALGEKRYAVLAFACAEKLLWSGKNLSLASLASKDRKLYDDAMLALREEVPESLFKQWWEEGLSRTAGDLLALDMTSACMGYGSIS